MELETLWPVLVAAAVILVVFGLIKKLVKLAFMGAVLAVVGIVVWQMATS